MSYQPPARASYTAEHRERLRELRETQREIEQLERRRSALVFWGWREGIALLDLGRAVMGPASKKSTAIMRASRLRDAGRSYDAGMRRALEPLLGRVPRDGRIP